MIVFNNPQASITQLESGETLGPELFKEAIEKKILELKKESIGPGSVVLIANPNSIHFFVNLLAIFSLGATVVPLDPNASELELENIKNHSGANLLIKDNKTFQFKKELNEELKTIALVLYTSGTTGKPKGVKLSFNALRSKIETLSKFITPDESKNTLCFLPTYFGHGLICNSLFALFSGEHFFIASKMDLQLASAFKNLINKNKITFFSSVPSVWDLVLNFSGEDDTSLPTLKRVHCASAYLQNEKAEVISRWLGKNVSFYNIFGITEISGWFAQRKFFPAEDINLFSDYFNAQTKFDLNGELLIKAPYMFSGYLADQEETAKAIDEKGFFRTGDIFKDSHYSGRSKFVINKKGIKIYPNELDEFFLNSTMVSDCHTFPVKDEFSGELIGVLIVLKEKITLEMFRKYCLKNLPANKFPDKIFVVPKIERTGRGKIAADSIKKYTGELK